MNEETKMLLEKIAKRKPKIETYQNDLCEYLMSKFAPYNIPLHVLKETAQYAIGETHIVVNEEIKRAYKQWRRDQERYYRRRRGATTENEETEL